MICFWIPEITIIVERELSCMIPDIGREMKTLSKTERGPRRILSLLLRALGSLLMLGVLLCAAVLAVPRLLGQQVYAVVSGSMEPALPVGSLVFVDGCDPDTLGPGEIIAFSRRSSVVTHRVVENQAAERRLITRGDANSTEDPDPVPYPSVLGRVHGHIPVLGRFLLLFSSGPGKIGASSLALAGFVLILAGEQLAKPEKKKEE